ncbi:hypothetical protein PP16_gp28 [Pectobacterium phage PP16]|uniref:Uncharacterized protein n=1 Tax=Pectobacterium phage PP16 TaxID=1873958 RepID=A0A1B1PED1_9CAUD|nr:hypothetical protein PP16_gp28 [Pectobacterium phage PP16]ANT45327.1 hypothetical protein PP16_gp28 [Pectobacterium phage PP16]
MSAELILVKALQDIAREPGCGCSFPCQCKSVPALSVELEERVSLAEEALKKFYKEYYHEKVNP